MRRQLINPQNDIKHLVSILLALIPTVVLYYLLPVVTTFIDSSAIGESISIILTSLFVLAITVAPCYYICRHNPASTWYVPALLIVTATWKISGMFSNYWTRDAKIWLLAAGLLLATIAGIAGSLNGDKTRDGN